MPQLPPAFPPDYLLNSKQSYADPVEENGFIYYHVYQELHRSIRRKASLRIRPLSNHISFSPQEEEAIHQVLKKWSKIKKPLYSESRLSLHSLLLEKAMDTQFFAEWLEYAGDGRQLMSKFMTIGPQGLQWLATQKQAEQEALDQWNEHWMKECETLAKHEGLSPVYDDLLRIAKEQHEVLFQVKARMRAKEQLFFQLIIHLLHLHRDGQTLFDWKEIGSKGYSRIGGSKVYDSHKEWLLDQLEERCRYSLEEIGFISLGQIIPVFFAGGLYRKGQPLEADPLGCITHLQLQQISDWSTSASFLIITENRSPLVKMALSGWIQQQNGLVICTDGHLKKPHKRLILQLAQEDRPIYGWVDYDPSGLDIAEQMVRMTGDQTPFVLTTNEKAPNRLGTFHELKEDIVQRQQQEQLIEQEQVLGNPADWDLLFA